MPERFTEKDIKKVKDKVEYQKILKLRKEAKKIIKDIYGKKEKKKKGERDPSDYKRDYQSRDKLQPPRSMTIDTTTSAYGDSSKGRPVPKFNHGGEAKVRGMGIAIKGGKFEGVF
tara:strand:- start:330 stop:674 length:345 start_codon:yes stop_codon:yes gene_type:complete